MRTQVQIQNLRAALFGIVGVYAFIVPDFLIDAWADNFQYRINGKTNWKIKVRFVNNLKASWDDIEFEPTNPFCSFAIMARKCYEMIEDHPAIAEILVVPATTFLDPHVFKKIDIKEH